VDPAALTAAQKELRRKAHETLAKADDDYGRRLAFNTVVSAVMELSNEIGRFEDDSEAGRAVVREALELAVLVLSPIAPHVCHELWFALGHETPLVEARWPAVDPAALERDAVELVVQVNGKVRARVEVPAGADEETAKARALAEENVRRFTEGKTLRKVIHVPDKLLNLVVGG
jgi:leucyl-tRNA synthetase